MSSLYLALNELLKGSNIRFKDEPARTLLKNQQVQDLYISCLTPYISLLGNIFSTGELVEAEVSSILEHTTSHGAIEGKTQTQKVKFYTLDAIIAVGYRVNSYQATQFRI